MRLTKCIFSSFSPVPWAKLSKGMHLQVAPRPLTSRSPRRVRTYMAMIFPITYTLVVMMFRNISKIPRCQHSLPRRHHRSSTGYRTIPELFLHFSSRFVYLAPLLIACFSHSAFSIHATSLNYVGSQTVLFLTYKSIRSGNG